MSNNSKSQSTNVTEQQMREFGVRHTRAEADQDVANWPNGQVKSTNLQGLRGHCLQNNQTKNIFENKSYESNCRKHAE